MKLIPVALALTLSACTAGRTMSIPEIVAIAEKDLNFTAYEVLVVPVSEVRKLCGINLVVGCTNDKVSLISDKLAGCSQAEIIFHELLHQWQFQQQARTGLFSIKEAPAYLYGAKMAQKHCWSN